MDAMDRQAFAIRYHGCLIVELYNEIRPHDALGTLPPARYRERLVAAEIPV
jgi:hypothetical protein